MTASVDVALRRRIRSHHTATHLLQSALKKVVGFDTSQQGSSVDAERLRCVGERGVGGGSKKCLGLTHRSPCRQWTQTGTGRAFPATFLLPSYCPLCPPFD